MAIAATQSRKATGQGNPLLNKYLKRMGEIPLLSREDEVEVARLVTLNGPDAEIAKQATLVVECSGHEQGALDACNMVKVRGEVVLVGVPWQRKTALYSHDLLHAVFHNYVVLRSGWEWEIPPSETFRFQHHTLRKNFETSLRWLAEGSIYLDGLCAMVDPRDCQEAYQNALHHKTEGLFTIFDWGRCS